MGGVVVAGIDPHTKLLLHLDNNVADDIGTHTPVNHGVTFDPSVKKWGYSGIFDGSSHVIVPDHADFNFGSDDLTIDCWVRFSSISVLQCVFNQFVDGNNRGGFFWNNSDSNLTIYVRSGGAVVISIAGSWSPTTATWYHIAAVRHSGTYKLYVDGVDLSATGTAGATWPDFAADVEIGRWYLTNYFDGYIDEMRVSNTARWTSDFTPPTLPYSICHGGANAARNHERIVYRGGADVARDHAAISTGATDGNHDHLTAMAGGMDAARNHERIVYRGGADDMRSHERIIYRGGADVARDHAAFSTGAANDNHDHLTAMAGGIDTARNHYVVRVGGVDNMRDHLTVVVGGIDDRHDHLTAMAGGMDAEREHYTKPGYGVYATNTDTGAITSLGFIDIDDDPLQLTGVALADGTYRIEACPAGWFWPCLRDAAQTLVKISGGDIVVLRPVVSDLVATWQGSGSRVRWNWTEAAGITVPTDFAIWISATTPVVTTGDPDRVIPYEGARRYQLYHAHTEARYLAIAGRWSATNGDMTEISMPIGSGSVTAPDAQYAEEGN